LAHLSGPLTTFGVAGAADTLGAALGARLGAALSAAVGAADWPVDPVHAAMKAETPARAVPWRKRRRLIAVDVRRDPCSLIWSLS
jgi:hypothetical protein